MVFEYFGDLKDEFMRYLGDIRHYSALTIIVYEQALTEMLTLVEIEQEDGVYLLNLMPFRLKIASQNSKTINKKLSAIRSFTAYLNERGIAVGLKADSGIKNSQTLPKPLSHERIVSALDGCDLHEKVVLTLLYTLGLRMAELESLEVANISSEWIRVIGKGSKERDIPLLDGTRKLLDEYIGVHKPSKYLFEVNGKRLSQNSLRYTISKIFKRAGVWATPHQMRHSFASELLNNGAPITDVSELLGHASIATTQIYTKLGNSLKQQNYHLAHPLCKGSN